jgi:hypothetical protein
MKSSPRPATSLFAFAVTIAVVAGCASPAPIPPPPPSAVVPFDGVRRVVVVASGESRFTGAQPSTSAQSSPSKELSVFDEVIKWVPWGGWVGPVSQLVRWGITWLMESQASAKTEPRDVSPAGVVASAFAQTVLVSGGPQPQFVVTDREPVGDWRKDADAIVRVAVPAWGVVRVQDGKPPLVAAFADVRAEMVIRETGVVLWKHEEDVTHPERLPEGTLGADRAAARERLTEVLERAGRRMGNELVYAMGRR